MMYSNKPAALPRAKTTAAEQAKTINDGLIEYTASMFSGCELLTSRIYENYVDNISTGFDNMLALSKTDDIFSFSNEAAKQSSKVARQMAMQSKSIAELSMKTANASAQAGHDVFTNGLIFSVSLHK